MVAIAEDNGLIASLGAWVLEKSCADHRRWTTDHPGLRLDLAVNVSSRQLMGQDFPGVVQEVLLRTAMDPAALTLEMTEGIVIDDDEERAMTVLADLRDLGVRIALDDFGTGYASLSYLRRFPVDVLKIDRSFVAAIGYDRSAAVIVGSICQLGHLLDLEVSAKGSKPSSNATRCSVPGATSPRDSSLPARCWRMRSASCSRPTPGRLPPTYPPRLTGTLDPACCDPATTHDQAVTGVRGRSPPDVHQRAAHHGDHCLVSQTLYPARGLLPGRCGVCHGVMAAKRFVEVDTDPLTEEDVVAVARGGAGVRLSGRATEAIAASRRVIDALAGDAVPHYGVSTGFGSLATVHIPVEQRAALQRSLIRSHAAGSGPEVEREVVRALMLLRLSTLATGRTGVRTSTAQAYAAMIDADITPVVHEYGSLGCSGDLAPLSHCALALMGEGPVRTADGTLMDAAQALRDHGLEPVVLAEKEGLALVNGTDGMLGMLVLAIADLRLLLRTADVACAMSVEALLGSESAYAADLQELRPHPGQAASASNLRTVLQGSSVVASHQGPECTRVQDAYSLRCAPAVHGAARDTVEHAATVAGRELAAAIDNPVVTVDGRVESNGNFHGAPVGYVLDFLAIAAADVASMSERRTDRFCDVSRNHGLPPFLAHDAGVDSGHMIAQYTAAGIVSELKRLAVPASVDSIPSSAMQEDHVSMGWAAARKLRRSVDGLAQVIAIEILTAARGLDLRAPLEPAAGTAAVRDLLRECGVAGPGPDRFLAPDIAAVVEAVRTGAVLVAVHTVTGELR